MDSTNNQLIALYEGWVQKVCTDRDAWRDWAKILEQRLEQEQKEADKWRERYEALRREISD